jgi:tetratricopeptide (TPR) repeat protein
VISRSSVMKYRGRNASPGQVAQELGVAAVLQGSVQKSGDRARINVQLVDAGTDAHVWSESWDFTIADLFEVQNRVALGVASALQIQLAFPERARMERTPTTSLPAYQLYLRAGGMDPYSSDGLRAGVDLLRQTTTLDPDFALAWAELSRRYGRLVTYDSLPAEELARAEDYARRAVALDPELAEGHHALGLSLWRADRTADARDSLLAALRVNPNYGIAMNNLSLIELNLGRIDQSLFWALEGFRRQPDRRASFYHVGLPLLLMADEETTRAWLDAGSERHTDYHRLEVLYTLLDLYHGRREQAAARMEDALARYPDNEEVLSMAIDVRLLTDPSGAVALARAGATAAPDSRTWFLEKSRRACLGYALVAAGAGAEGESMMREALAVARQRAGAGADAPALLLEIAGLEAMTGEHDTALDWLRRARESGWRDYVVLEQDPLLDTLRADPAFRALLDRMRADVVGMRERSRDLVAAAAELER